MQGMQSVNFAGQAKMKPLIKTGLIVFIDREHDVIRLLGTDYADVTAVK
mgnify:CR=1 FL=1